MSEMSMGEEYAVEIMIEEQLYMDRMRGLAEKGIWTMRDGKEIHVSEMTDRHIANCVRMLEKSRNPAADYFISMFEKEQNRRTGV